ncbi:methionine biosynthesis protein MetW [Coralliovum pocilloporae]|uniref:methionine biosynthesis protein MetW n=1 Tax=Coralliovum pocilloporae TaxID=3066369 RepID=UPI00330799DE
MNLLNQNGGRTMAADPNRVDHRVIADLIEPNTRLLDVGCSNGTLLSLLKTTKGVDGRGIELSQKGVNECVARGLSVIQGDADIDLVYYPDKSFDYAVLSQTIQATHDPRAVLEHLLRIGQKAIVSFPNFGHWTLRLQVLAHGRMPVSKNLPYTWYDTPNIHFCTIVDFLDLCKAVGVKIEKSVVLSRRGMQLPETMPWKLRNLLGEQAVLLLSAD